VQGRVRVRSVDEVEGCVMAPDPLASSPSPWPSTLGRPWHERRAPPNPKRPLPPSPEREGVVHRLLGGLVVGSGRHVAAVVAALLEVGQLGAEALVYADVLIE